MKHDRLSVEWLNGLVASAPRQLVADAERIYNGQIERTADSIMQKKADRSILLVSGPSASTKTTTAMKLSAQLQKRSIGSVVISLDDFFVDRERLPLLPNGETDFESIHTLDLETLDRCFGELLRHRVSDFPMFHFPTGRRSEETRRIEVDSETMVIVEGIHALNPEITKRQDADRFRKVYISPNSEYYMGEQLVLGVRDIRLIRRMVRDYFHRGNPIENTMRMWENVVASEIVNIIPYRDEADYVINSTILYEPNIYEYWLDRILDQSVVGEKYAKKMAELTRALSVFVPLSNRFVPADTVLHEFLE